MEPAPPLEPVAPGYRHVLRARMAVTWTVLLVGSLVADRIFAPSNPLAGLGPAAVLAIAIAAILIAPGRVYRRLRYRLTDRLLQVVRGWVFHTDTIVPLVRVQHIDVVRGPFDKAFGTASLVVHTAGTHNSIITVPGLAPRRAAEIRDVIREHVRSDFD